MITNHFTFEGVPTIPYTLHAVIWLPEDQNVTAVLQIAHGMTEHIGRYEAFAEYLTQCGIAVAGFDLRGHGHNEGDKDCASFGENGWGQALEDIHIFYKLLREKFPQTKHFMLGFSLGSFLLREYFTKYSHKDVAGAIIMGTGHQPAVVLSMLISVIKGEIKKAGWDQTTPLVQNLSFGTYNKKFKPNRTASDWLCADEKNLDEYISDELCRKDISAELFADLLSAMKRTGESKACSNWKKDMPVLLLSGKDDPVGDFGKGVQVVYQQLVKNGVNQAQIELFEGARHDLLHEEKSGAAEKAKKLILEWMLKQ